jgi:hypothetical protein
MHAGLAASPQNANTRVKREAGATWPPVAAGRIRSANEATTAALSAAPDNRASDMRLIIVSGLFAIVLLFAIGLFATKKRVGLDVSERFLERLDEIPSGATERQRELSSDNLKN